MSVFVWKKLYYSDCFLDICVYMAVMRTLVCEDFVEFSHVTTQCWVVLICWFVNDKLRVTVMVLSQTQVQERDWLQQNLLFHWTFFIT